MKKLVRLVTIVACVAILGACSSSNDSSKESSAPSTEDAIAISEVSESTEEPVETEENAGLEEITYGSVFEFDQLEICFSNDIEFSTIDNEFSDKNGAEVIAIPVAIKNLSDETHGLNMFYYSVYGSQGTKASTAGSFYDNDVDLAGDMRSGASLDTYFHIIYDGDGDYYIEFDNFTEKMEVRLPISK